MKKKTTELTNVLKELNDLEAALKAGKASNPDIQGSPFKIIDLSLPYNTLFNNAAKRGMMCKIRTLEPIRKLKHPSTLKPEVFDRIVLFARMVRGVENLFPAAKLIANQINEAASKGYVTGELAPLSCMEMISEYHELEKYVVFCYVAMTEEGYNKYSPSITDPDKLCPDA